MSGSIHLSKRGEVGIITISNPVRMNAWDRAMRAQLVSILRSVENDDGISCAVITGDGDRAFCAGQNFNEAVDFEDTVWIDEIQTLYDTIRRFSKPLVAAINGVAAGSGFQLTLLCDARIGHKGVRLGQTEVAHGIPSITGTWLMVAAVGVGRTSSMVLRGSLVSGEEALAVGFLDELVPEDEVLDRAIEISSEMGSKRGVAFQVTKDWLREMTQDGFIRAFDEARDRHQVAIDQGEPQAGMSRFLEDSVTNRVPLHSKTGGAETA
jgi:enoyl-CoA hydratase